MGNEKRRFLCLTICAYRRDGLSEEEYHHYMTKVHAPLVQDLMVQYGIKNWTMVVSPFDSSYWHDLTTC
jgi:hypothetical protein